ncbi:MAG: hypothetical protein EBU57_08870 [Alphaproteobacteria bacterium]|nr:hypothetical protein [Alphaproteobacteria bacterium]
MISGDPNSPLIFSGQTNPYLRQTEQGDGISILGKKITKNKALEILKKLSGGLGEEDEEGNKTGNLLVKFKKNGTGQRKGGSRYTLKLPVVDGQGQEVPKDIVARLGRGTRMVVAYRAEAYCMNGVFGVTLKIEAVQIVEPMFRQSNDALDAFKGRELQEAFTVQDFEE